MTMLKPDLRGIAYIKAIRYTKRLMLIELKSYNKAICRAYISFVKTVIP